MGAGVAAVTGLIAYAGFRFGLPAASEHIVRTLPQHVNEKVSVSALATLDRLMFEPSEISESRKEEVKQQVEQLLAALSLVRCRVICHDVMMSGCRRKKRTSKPGAVCAGSC